MRGSIEDFSHALKLLYAAAATPSSWPEALRALEDLAGSAGATINFVPHRADQQGFVLAGRFSADLCAEFARDYMQICPRTTYAVQHQPDVLYDAMILTEAEMDREPVYQWFGYQGLRYHVGGALEPVRGLHANFSFQRTRKQGHVEPADIALFRQLREHVGQAVTLAASLDSLQIGHQATAAVLNRLPQGVFILGSGGEILFMNAAADRLAAQGTGLQVRDNRLQITDAGSDARLGALIRGAAAIGAGAISGQGGWLSLNRGSAYTSLSLFVAPATADTGINFSRRPSVMVIVYDRRSIGPEARAMLIDLFGLTPTEAAIATLIGSGFTIEQAALQMNQAVGTARIHLKAIFRKTSVNRQQDLVRLVTGLVSQGMIA